MSPTRPSRKEIRRSRKKNQELKKLLFLGSAAVLIMVVFAVVSNQAQQANSTLSAEQEALLIREDSPTRGPADAAVTLVEFLDPECESCRAAYPVVEQILADYEGQIRYVVRYFPNHNNSMLAIAATEAASEQGMYWEMQEILFANQLEWGEQSLPQLDLMLSYAAELGLDVEEFTASLPNPDYVAKAQRDRQDGVSLGVRGTPTFFVNGQAVLGMDEGMLRQLIDAALQ
jgi:protein-disulfide isomerase